MDQRRLFRTIESFASEAGKNEKTLLKHVVREIVRSDKINIKGGRIWQYDSSSESYILLNQTGVIEKLEQGYRIPVSQYPTFVRVGKERSVLAKETDRYLRKMGIIRYSATGVGDRLQYRDTFVYQYILAFNSDSLNNELLADLNIISLAVSTLLGRMKIERKATLLAKDIDKASEIQQSILPESAISFHHYDIYGHSIPDRIVGGDFFDYLFVDEDRDRLGIVIGDAASKGLKAAAQAMYVSGAIRMGVNYNIKIASLMSRINSLLQQTFSEENFISMFYGEFLNDRKGLLLYANAGHNSPILFRMNSKEIELLEPTGQLLGPFSNEKYGVENTYINKGDILVLYTDGITEARNSDGDFFGEKRLIQKIKDLHTQSSETICKEILKAVDVFSKGVEEGDDKTTVVLKRIN